jgi:hypothetical protein
MHAKTERTLLNFILVARSQGNADAVVTALFISLLKITHAA